ncbi:MAG: hypothetical protein JNM75_04790 [Rhodospirillales bacterium]|nr:hypothetical protein [Rhodospirillales bacterium]
MIGWLLLAGTIGVVSCQALFTSGRDPSPHGSAIEAPPQAPAAPRSGQ